MKILVPLGTRPEIVKLAPVVRELSQRGHEVLTVATGQHYDASLTDTFFDELGMQPAARWTLPASEAARVGAILSRAYQLVEETKPDLVVVQGDTYTVPLFCIAARRFRTAVAHLEAGLRSFNDTSMEEVDRKIAAATAQVHFAPTQLAATFLHREGVDPRRVFVVGNSVLDVLRQRNVRAHPPAQRRGVVVTAHRSTNVDNPDRLRSLVEIVTRLQADVGPVTFPVHPRTRARLEVIDAVGLLAEVGVDVRDPVPFDTMLDLVARSRVVVTDSGGLQEEAAWMGVPVVVMRRSTPRWESVASGASVLTGLDVERTVDAARLFASDPAQRRVAALPCPFGDGRTAERVADILEDAGVADLLRIDEPDFVGAPLPC